MDRFIVSVELVETVDTNNLKSNMDRFIAAVRIEIKNSRAI